MATLSVPSVLAHPPTLAPPPSAAVPSAPPASAPIDQVRCSQCKKYKPLSHYPTRIINLKPYQVCKAHAWYWTQAKQLSQWAPSHSSSLAQVCHEAATLGTDQAGHCKWLLNGQLEDRRVLVEELATAGNWRAEEIATRPSIAKGDAVPSPTWTYTLWPESASAASTSAAPPVDRQGTLKLQLWYHESANAFTLVLKAERVTKDPGPWARPGRVRLSGPAREAQRTSYPDSISAAPPCPNVRIPQKGCLQSATTTATSASHSTPASNVDRDREQMPPPPLPSARPSKRIRRVEPQLVSPMPTSLASNGAHTPFSAAATEWSHFLSFPTLLQPQQSSTPTEQTRSLQYRSGDFPLDPLLLPSFSSSAPTSGSLPSTRQGPLRSLESRPLSLAELLSSAIFEPPVIDLPPRTSGQHSASAMTSRAGRELDAAVADALGATPDALDSSEEDGPEDADKGYYEDSIPDESSAEEDIDETERDDATVSSFFESSAEETEYDSDADGWEEAESGDDGEDNWLEGFAAQQMGLRRETRRQDEDEDEEGEGEGGEEAVEEEDDDGLDEGDDELSEGDEPPTATSRRLHAHTSSFGHSAQQVEKDADDEEIDELDSPSSDPDEGG